MNCEYCNITLAKNKAPWWWSDKIETCRNVLKCLKVFYVRLHVHSLDEKFRWFYENARCYNNIYCKHSLYRTKRIQASISNAVNTFTHCAMRFRRVRYSRVVQILYIDRFIKVNWKTNSEVNSVRKHNYKCILDDGIYWQSK